MNIEIVLPDTLVERLRTVKWELIERGAGEPHVAIWHNGGTSGMSMCSELFLRDVTGDTDVQVVEFLNQHGMSLRDWWWANDGLPNGGEKVDALRRALLGACNLTE